jgi:hypothetical protein
MGVFTFYSKLTCRGTQSSVLGFKTIREIGRDSRGRIHNESRASMPVSSTDAPPLIRVHLYDPQTRLSTWFVPRDRVFWSLTVNHPPSTVPPAIRFGSPAGEGLPENEFTKQEDLGIHEMEGVSAHGIRETQTIPAEISGTGERSRNHRSVLVLARSSYQLTRQAQRPALGIGYADGNASRSHRARGGLLRGSRRLQAKRRTASGTVIR